MSEINARVVGCREVESGRDTEVHFKSSVPRLSQYANIILVIDIPTLSNPNPSSTLTLTPPIY